jgi:glycosyltransferase involved in cell wall biosynthesis
MRNPTVSIIMPVRNAAAVIGETIQSVLAQSFSDWELLVIDDGSSDDTIALCKEFADPRIRVLNRQRQGFARARNAGIEVARGSFIAFLDAKDIWHPSKLMLHVIQLCAHSQIDVSFAASQPIDARGAIAGAASHPRLKHITPTDILVRNPIGPSSTAVVRRSALDRAASRDAHDRSRLCWFDESFAQGEELDLWLRLAIAHGCRFEGIDGVLTQCRIDRNGPATNLARQFEAWQHAIEKAQVHAPVFIARYRAIAAASQLFGLARRAASQGDGSFALSLFRQGVAREPAILIEAPIQSLRTMIAAITTRWLSPAGLRFAGAAA